MIECDIAHRLSVAILCMLYKIRCNSMHILHGTLHDVDGGSEWRAGARETEVRLDGWCKGGVGQQRKDGGGCASMRERSERVDGPGTYVTELVLSCHFR